MVDVQRKSNESIGSLLRRFSRYVQQSGVLLKRKAIKHRVRTLTDRQEKNRAIMGMHLSALRKRLEKLGTYTDESFHEAKRRLKQEIEL